MEFIKIGKDRFFLKGSQKTIVNKKEMDKMLNPKEKEDDKKTSKPKIK